MVTLVHLTDKVTLMHIMLHIINEAVCFYFQQKQVALALIFMLQTDALFLIQLGIHLMTLNQFIVSIDLAKKKKYSFTDF